MNSIFTYKSSKVKKNIQRRMKRKAHLEKRAQPILQSGLSGEHTLSYNPRFLSLFTDSNLSTWYLFAQNDTNPKESSSRLVRFDNRLGLIGYDLPIFESNTLYDSVYYLLRERDVLSGTNRKVEYSVPGFYGSYRIFVNNYVVQGLDSRMSQDPWFKEYLNANL